VEEINRKEENVARRGIIKHVLNNIVMEKVMGGAYHGEEGGNMP
jgi:hypothetical protein